MAEIVNLRMVRKAHQREDAQAQAAAKRARHGESKASAARRRQDAERAARELDGAFREAD